MGVSTTGFVVTDVKDALLIIELARGAVDQLIADELAICFPGTKRWQAAATGLFKFTDVNISAGGIVQMHFTFHGERRTMSVHFDCDCDYLEYGPESVSFSLGCFGESELFITSVAFALSALGQAYVDRNDSDSIDPQQLQETPLPLCSAIRMGYASILSVRLWIKALQRHGWPRKRIAQALGLTESKLDLHYWNTGTYEELKALVASAPLRNPSFLEEHHARALGKTEATLS